MSIEETNTIDLVTVEAGTGNVLLTISDHLPWQDGEGRHLQLLQEKVNAYLRFIESGELVSKVPEAVGLAAVINIVGKCPPTEQGQLFLHRAGEIIRQAGLELRFSLLKPH